GQGLREQGLARAGGAEQQDVRLGQFDALVAGPGVAAGLDPLVVVVDRDRQRLLGLLLADHIGVEEFVDLARLGEAVPLQFGRFGDFSSDVLFPGSDPLAAYVYARAGVELFDLLRALPAERAFEKAPAVADASPPVPPSCEARQDGPATTRKPRRR